MSSLIQGYVKELEGIKAEIQRNNNKNKKLRSRQRTIEKEIKQYLEAQKQPGLKFKDKDFVLEHTTSYTRRKKSEKEQEIKRFLKNSGITDVDYVYKNLETLRKGEEVQTTKLKIKNNKKKNSSGF